ncbi:hypothetical protein CF326_g8389, partial [Tilletia indica]
MSGLINSGHLRVGTARQAGNVDSSTPPPKTPVTEPQPAVTAAPSTHPARPTTHTQTATQQPEQLKQHPPQRVAPSAPVFAAAKEALGGSQPTIGACANYLAKTLQAQLPSIPSRSAASKATPNRVYITVDIIKALQAAAAFIAAETDKTSEEKLRSIQASIQSLSDAQAATAAAVADIAANTRKTQEAVNTAAEEAKNPAPARPSEVEQGWTVVDRRNKNRRTGHLPLSQRLPSNEVIFSTSDKKKPPFKASAPNELVAKARAAIAKAVKEDTSKFKDWSEAEDVDTIHIVRSARALPSGDWIVTFGTAKWARLACKNKETWLSHLHPGFFIKDSEFEVAVDLVPLTFSMEEFSHYKDIMENNPVLQDSTSIDWTGGERGLAAAKAKKKRHGTLLIRFQRAADANELIMSPLSFDGRLLPTRKSVRRPPQCNRCQGYGHIAIQCRGHQKCAKCGGAHATSSCHCPVEEEANRCTGEMECAHLTFLCANCKGHHPATSRDCPSRSKAFKMAQNWAFNSGELFLVEHEWDNIASRLLVDPMALASKYSMEAIREEEERIRALEEENAERIYAARNPTQASVAPVSTYLLQSSSSPVKPQDSPPPPPSQAKTIRSIQLNCAKRSTTMHSLMNSAPQQGFDLVFVQEPHTIKTTGAPSTYQGWRPFFPAFDDLDAIDTDLPSRVITYASLSRFPGSSIETLPT